MNIELICITCDKQFFVYVRNKPQIAWSTDERFMSIAAECPHCGSKDDYTHHEHNF